jgi:hypothetical protein
MRKHGYRRIDGNVGWEGPSATCAQRSTAFTVVTLASHCNRPYCVLTPLYFISDRQRYMDEFNDLSRKDVFCFLLSTRAGGEHVPAGLTVCVGTYVLDSSQANGTFSSPFDAHLMFDRFGDQPSLGRHRHYL